MNDPSIYAEVAKAVPVVMGGLLAALAGVATQFLTHHLTIKREERNAKRERLESFVKAIYAHERWLEDRFQAALFRDEDHRTPSPLSEARMIQALYFPELAAELSKVQTTTKPLMKYIGDQKLIKMKDPIAWSATWNRQPYYDSYTEYGHAMNALTTKCRELGDA
jgi:hypothetical protein